MGPNLSDRTRCVDFKNVNPNLLRVCVDILLPPFFAQATTYTLKDHGQDSQETRHALNHLSMRQQMVHASSSTTTCTVMESVL